MAKIIIREVSVNEQNLNLKIEFDFSVVSGGSNYMFNLSLSKPQYLYWKESNPSGTLDDYIIENVKSHYDLLKAQRDLAVTLNLVDKSLTW